jgi:dCMP deaminase
MTFTDPLKWYTRFMDMADLICTWSKDPSTKVASVAINEKKQLLSMGYNGFPRGIKDIPERYETREVKYKYVLHAEQNLISNAVANGVSLDRSIVLVSGLPPCDRCALELIQADISTIVVKKSDIAIIKANRLEWWKSWQFSNDLFGEAGVRVIFL